MSVLHIIQCSIMHTHLMQENASCKELDKLEPFAPSTNVNRTTGAGPLPNTSTYEDFMEKFDYMDHSK